jgi:4'-phosphopantetheinyl transferase
VHRDRIDLQRLAARNFTPAELVDLDGLEGEDFRDGFFRVWTRKEAYVKALGQGLYHSLADFDVNAADEARFGAFRDGSDLERWSLIDLPLGPGRSGALAVELAAVRLRRTP